MKRIRFILFAAAALLLMNSFPAQAKADDDGAYIEHVVKWYEDLSSISGKYGVPADVIISINKLSGKTLRTRQILLIPISERYWKTDDDRNTDNASDTVSDIYGYADSMEEDNGKVSFALLLPFTGHSGVINANNMDFYSGALLAVRELGQEGVDIEMNVFDYTTWRPDTVEFMKNHFVIGPVKSDEIHTVLEGFGERITLVSPLDSKAEGLEGQHGNLVQAAAGTSEQYRAALEWAQEMPVMGRKVRYVIISSINDAKALNEAQDVFDAAGIEYSVCFTDVKGDITGWNEKSLHPWEGHNMVILAISNEAVLNNAIRNMSILSTQGNVTVFTGSRIRSYTTIPEENIHKAGVHVLCPYYVDYSNERTLSFIHSYRALFKNEPSQFSFQGYDLTYHIVNARHKLGREWKDRIAEEPEAGLLHTNIKFRKDAEGNLKNTGMRRVVYNPDFSVTLVGKQ